ncbi:histidine phosphatase family protein [Gymnodinialimonas hymeniacidonis]|uniref:histidine phosphatase family protein n=1 Tax=Gymnodinialimonas hymeniacidonis TaxID=3126508 RepID=UPI0034C6DC3F
MARPDYPPIYVLRHGQTEWNLADRMQGWGDSPLTPLGRAQAEVQRAILADVLDGSQAAFYSPSGRAKTTAQIALGAHFEAAVEDARLQEINVGDWTGRTPTEIAAEVGGINPTEDWHMWKFGAPGGETLDDMTVRCQAVLDALTQPTILVTHGVTSRLLRCLALGLPPEALGTLPGGQGVVHAVENGKACILGQ